MNQKPRFKLHADGQLEPVKSAAVPEDLETRIQGLISLALISDTVRVDRTWQNALHVGVCIMERMGCVPGNTREPELTQRLLRAVWETAEAHSKGLR